MDSYSAARSCNFRCVQKILLTSLLFHSCHITFTFLPSGFFICLLPQDKQFTELHVVTGSYMTHSYAFLILVIYLQASLLDNTLLITMVTSDNVYHFYINLKAILFRDEEPWCTLEARRLEFVEQVWANIFLPVTFPSDNWRIVSL